MSKSETLQEKRLREKTEELADARNGERPKDASRVAMKRTLIVVAMIAVGVVLLV